MAKRFYAEDYRSRNNDFDNDGVRIEMEPVDSYSQFPGASTSRIPDNHDIYNDHYALNENYHTIPRSLKEQLPSRSMDVTRKPSSHGSCSLHGTLRIRTVSILKDLSEDKVIEMLENDPKIEDLDELAAGKHTEATLKQLHYSLTGKRKVKARLDKRGSKLHKKVGCLKQMKYTLSMKWYKFKNGLKESLSSLELWQKPIHIIEGKFGTSVASYFYLLRWLLRLNVLTFLLQFSFVVGPQMLLNFFPDAQEEPLPCRVNSTISGNFTKLPIKMKKSEFSPEILLTGSGWLEYSSFYYGGYSNTILTLANGVYYNIPLAYLSVIGVNIVLVLIFMAVKLAKSHKERFIEHSGLKMNFFSNKVFCGWDFAITNPKAAQLHSACLRLDLIEYLSRLQKRTIIRTIEEKTIRFFRFLFFHFLSFAVLGLTGYLIFVLLHEKYLNTDIKVLGEMSLSLTVVLITIVVPSILTFMVKFEGYHSRRIQLWINMIRSLLLIGVIIGILLLFWIPGINLSLISTILTTNNEFNKHSCWETQLGMEIYRLVIMDFIVCCVLHFFTFWIKSILYKSGFKYLGTVEFDVAWNFWNLLYNQYSLRLHAQPAEQSLRAQNAQTIFLIIAFLALVFSLLGMGYIIIQVKPSMLCGPFSARDYPYSIIFCITESFQEYEICVTYYSRALAAANLKMMTLLRQQVVLEGKDKVMRTTRGFLRNVDPIRLNRANFLEKDRPRPSTEF
uniref:TMC domain-containing protein n=1 Tax=Strigamia maritima TaxID=126957 RepID=T1JNJ5_STRMM